jgi:DNA end-binding protein Ku
MVAVEPRGSGMAFFMLRAADEVRAAQFEMVGIARAIIGQRTGSFDPTAYRDRYQEALGGKLHIALFAADSACGRLPPEIRTSRTKNRHTCVNYFTFARPPSG